MKHTFIRVRARLSSAVALSLAVACPVAAQDFERIAPKEVPPLSGQSPAAPTKEGIKAAPADLVVLARVLKGVVLVPTPKEVKREGIPELAGVDVSRFPELQTPEFQARISKFIGKPLTLAAIDQISREIVVYYTERDRPFVAVSSPEQDVTSGVLQLLIVEGHVGEVKITGAKYFDEKLYRDAIGLKPGDPILKRKLDASVDWINRNPFRDASAYLEPGRAFGTTDVTVRARERYPLRLYAGFEDTGTQTTGNNRALAGVNWGNVFGSGHQLNYQFTADENASNYKAHSATYIAPLPWQHLLTVFGAYSDVKGNVPAPFTLRGRSSQLGLRYEIPLTRTPGFRHSFISGLDYKRSNNNLEFGGLAVSPSSPEIVQAVLSYDALLTDNLGATSITGSVFLSPGGITGSNTDAAFQKLRAFAQSDYTYANVQLRRVTRLPADFSWHFSIEAQLAGANLLPSEQLGAGGYTSVRGYNEREANGDQGYIVRNELRTPALNLGSPLPGKQAQIQFLAFVDYGQVNNKHLLPGELARVELASAGLGTRFALADNVSMRFDYGWQLRDDRVVGGRSNSRPHFALMIAF